MIAKVRIAPVEQWCPEAQEFAVRRSFNLTAIVGAPIAILTETRQFWNQKEADHYNPRACSGAYWDVAEQSIGELAALFDYLIGRGIPVVCEHMLEMD